MMPTKVVSFREDEEALRFVRQQGLNPNVLAKQAFEKAVERIRAAGAAQWLRRHPMDLDEPPEATLRRMRDSR